MKQKAIEYEPVAPPSEWKPDSPPVVVERPLIHINLASSAAQTFGWFLIWSVVVIAIESLLYRLCRACLRAWCYR
jgi:hypothetical protein